MPAVPWNHPLFLVWFGWAWVEMCTQGVRMLSRTRVLTLNEKKTFRQLPAGARMSQTKLLAGVSRPALLLHQICWCLPWHDPGFTSSQKTNIKRAALCCRFFSTSATVYLLGSTLPLFLQVPDIIIAVRWMIICLLWKLADCLSPVPEELPPPRDFSWKSGTKVASASARTHKGADWETDRRARCGTVEYGRKKWKRGKKMAIP